MDFSILKVGSDWLNIVQKAWSFRFMAAGFVVEVVNFVLPYYMDGIRPSVMGAIAAVLFALGAYSRLVPQKDVD